MAQQNRVTLKTYFETDDEPDEGEFIDLIDSSLNILDNGLLTGVEDNIVAFAGGGQANAYQLSKLNNAIQTCATAGDSIKLPVGVPGRIIHIFNNGVNLCNVFPSTGGFIKGQAVNASVVLGSTKSATLFCYATDKWGIIV